MSLSDDVVHGESQIIRPVSHARLRTALYVGSKRSKWSLLELVVEVQQCLDLEVVLGVGDFVVVAVVQYSSPGRRESYT